MEAKESILTSSPLDRIPIRLVDQVTPSQSASLGPGQMRWKPSRFNVQTTTEEGWLLLWNSYTGSMNAFRPHQRDAIIDLITQTGVSGEKSGIIGYLADRGYLVPGEADELRRIQYDFGRENHRSDKLELILLASEDCNFRCTYCYEDFNRGTMRPDVRAGVKQLVRNRLSNLRELNVSWFGGEPLYGMDAVEELAPFFANLSEEYGIDYYSHMTTNGYLLTKEVARRLISWKIVDYQITLDGLPENHNQSRKARDGSDTFDTILQNLTDIATLEEDFVIAIRVNFDKTNAPGLEKFIRILEERFSNDDRFLISFHAVGKWGGDNDADLSVCGADESHKVRVKLKAAAKALGLNVGSGWQPGAGVGTEVCYAVRPYNFIVGAHGDLMKCTIDLDKKDHNIVGKLMPDGEMELDIDKMALWTEPAFERDSGCQKCHMLAACQGVHCPKIRIDSGRRPCPGSRRTVKGEMIAFFKSPKAVERLTNGPDQHDPPEAASEAIAAEGSK